MAYNSERQDSNLALVREFLKNILIYEINSVTAEIYGKLQSQLMENFASREKSKRRKTKLGNIGFSEHDLWISCVAIQYGLTLVSADSDFQRIKTVCNLSIESWYQPAII